MLKRIIVLCVFAFGTYSHAQSATTTPASQAQQQQAMDANVAATINAQNKSTILLPPIAALPQNCGELGAASLGSPNLGGSIYLPRDNVACDRRLDSILMLAMGHEKAALYRMCQGKQNAEALNRERPGQCAVVTAARHKWWQLWH